MDPGTIMALISAVSSISGGLTGEKGGQGSTYNKNQLQGIDQILNDIKGMRGKGSQDISQQQNFQQGQGFLNDLFNDPDFFNNIEAPSLRQFNEEILPGVASRFASQGTGGSLGSTAFRNALGRESSNLAERLSANRTGMQQQGTNQALGYGQAQNNNFMQLLQQALQPTQNTYQGPSQGIFGGLAAPFAQGAASYWGGQGGMNNNNNQNYANGGA